MQNHLSVELHLCFDLSTHRCPADAGRASHMFVVNRLESKNMTRFAGDAFCTNLPYPRVTTLQLFNNLPHNLSATLPLTTMSNLTTQDADQSRSVLSNWPAMDDTTLSNGNGSMLQGNRHYISYTYPDQNWLATLPPAVQTSLCLLAPRGGSRRRRPRFLPWLTPVQANGLKHFNILRTESDEATCRRPPSPEEEKELLTDAIWRVVEATGNTHLSILTTAVQQENGLQVRFHIRRLTTLFDGSIESVDYHYSLHTFDMIISQFAEASLENGRRDPAAKQWYVNLVDLICQTTDRAYLEVVENCCGLVENFPDAEFYRVGPDFHFLDEGVVDLVLEYVGIDLIEDEGGVGPDRICAICTELMRVDKESEHAAVKLSCGHCFGVEW
jgi:hypothetical protein